MSDLHFRLAGFPRSLSQWLSMLLPAIDRSTRLQMIEDGRIRIGEKVADRPGFVCPPGSRIEMNDVDDPGLPSINDEARCEWFAWVDEPAWPSGELRVEAINESADASTTSVENLNSFEFVVEQRREGLALLSLSGTLTETSPGKSSGTSSRARCRVADLCRALATAGMPVVGDLFSGGLGWPGGPAIAARLGEVEALDVFDVPPWPKAESADAPLTLKVSEEVSRALTRGHPWILPDQASDSSRVFAPGTELRVENREGAVLGWAWSEGDERLSARMAATGDLTRKQVPSIESRVARAIGLRRGLLFADSAGGLTDCFRLLHGEADGLPGLFVDRLGPLLRVLVTSRATDGFRERALAALLAQMPTTPEGVAFSVIELMHLRAGGRASEFDRVRWVRGGPEALRAAGVEAVGEGFWVEERGLRFSVDPGWDLMRRTRPGFGLFPDQRENRERLAPFAARGGRWLNLFAHTGAFSVSLLAAGAAEVSSVDLSAPYLKRLEDNLEANRDRGVDPSRHRSLRVDGRHFIESTSSEKRYAGIVLDPPTAAAAGRRFWSVRQDLEPLLRGCMGRLEPGGTLLVTQNGRGAALGLDQILERVASRSNRRVRAISPAGPSADFPSLVGFPEGDAFEGWLIELEG